MHFHPVKVPLKVVSILLKVLWTYCVKGQQEKCLCVTLIENFHHYTVDLLTVVFREHSSIITTYFHHKTSSMVVVSSPSLLTREYCEKRSNFAPCSHCVLSITIVSGVFYQLWLQTTMKFLIHNLFAAE